MLTLIWIFLATNILCVLGTNLVHVPCDDKIVEKLSRLAVTYINEDRQTGYKFALNRITNVQAHQQVGKKCYFYQWKGNHSISRSTNIIKLIINNKLFCRLKVIIYVYVYTNMYLSFLQDTVYFTGPLSLAVGSCWKGLLSWFRCPWDQVPCPQSQIVEKMCYKTFHGNSKASAPWLFAATVHLRECLKF